MPQISAFLARNIVAIFFVYGLAFFSMGLAVMLESRRASELPIARAMGLLAGFGLLHGVHEWIEMSEIMASQTACWTPIFWLLGAGRLFILALSFLFLFAYGVRLILPEEHWPWRVLGFTAGVAVLWVGASLAAGWALKLSEAEWVKTADVLSRYLLAVPGAILASWALVLQQRALQAEGMPAFGRDLLWSAGAFFLYGALGQVFTRPSPIFPSTILNSELFLRVFGVPVQLFRAIMATIIALFIIHALRAFELESRQRLAAANAARLAAQQQALEEQRRRQEEIAALNLELQAAARELSVLYDLSRILSSTLDLDTLLKEAVRRIVEALDSVSAAAIWLRDEVTGELNVMAHYGRRPSAGVSSAESQPWTAPAHRPQTDKLPKGGELFTVARIMPFERARRVVQAAAKAGHAMGWYPDDSIAPILGEKLAEGQEPGAQPRLVGVPLVSKGRTIGGLVLGASQEQVGFSPDDLPLIGAMALPITMAVENATLYREVKSREAVRGELLHRIVSAQESERQRIARELHDETGQTLTALALGLKAARENLEQNPRLAAEQLDELRMQTSQALDALRRMVLDLRPSQLDDLGLPAALRWYVEDYRTRVPLQVDMEVQGTPRRLKPDVESVLFRIAQEALTNVAKHAAASHVKVELEFRDASVSLAVSDDGVGFNPANVLKPQARRKAWGLLGMQERAELVGGQCQIVSRPGHGTWICVEVPLAEEVVDDQEDQAAVGR